MAGKPRKAITIELTPDAITVWAEQVAGMTVISIAERHGVSERCVYKWLAQAKQQLAMVPNIETMRNGLHALYPDAINAIKWSLKNGSDCGAIGLRLLQGLSVLVNKAEIDVNDKRQLTNDELRRGIDELISEANKRVVGDDVRTDPS